MTDLQPPQLIQDLVADLRPVRRIGSPRVQALGWLAIVLAIAVALAFFTDTAAMEHHLMVAPDMWLAVLGSALTAAFAAFAAFELGRPDRSPAWSLLPVPGLVLWLGASGMGCARDWLPSGWHGTSVMEAGHCMIDIVSLSVPLSIVIFVMLRRGYSLHPSLMSAMAGLAVAAAAATLLNFFHPSNPALTDLAVHAVAITVIVFANRFLGAALFQRRWAIGGARFG